MIRIIRDVLWMVGCWWLMACQSDLPMAEEEQMESFNQLEFQVFSKTTPSGHTGGAENADETLIKELYIYAFDDQHERPDFYQDVFVNQGVGAVQNYPVKMRINGLGEKRFYLIANPPRYIKEKLTLDCSEGQLKSMSIALQHPITDIATLPQSADGVSSPKGQRGFPMANQFTAYVREGLLKGRLSLDATSQSTGVHIEKIPIFRSLGKVSVTIRKTEVNQDILTVRKLRLFNYACNGYFLPYWTAGVEAWNAALGTWNPAMQLDLLSMSEYETKVGVDAVSLIQDEIPVVSTQPQLLTSFYVCQNSFGLQMPGDSQPGITDVDGNRTTKLVIELSDGRQSVLDFPYLRRNDHLKVKIEIAKNIIQVTFLPWVLNEVTPEWEEDTVLPSIE